MRNAQSASRARQPRRGVHNRFDWFNRRRAALEIESEVQLVVVQGGRDQLQPSGAARMAAGW